MTSLAIIAGAAAGFLIGWYTREIKYHYDARMREDRILRTIQDRIERDDIDKRPGKITWLDKQ